MPTRINSGLSKARSDIDHPLLRNLKSLRRVAYFRFEKFFIALLPQPEAAPQEREDMRGSTPGRDRDTRRVRRAEPTLTLREGCSRAVVRRVLDSSHPWPLGNKAKSGRRFPALRPTQPSPRAKPGS